MRVELHRVGWRDWRPWHARSGDTRGSLAWSRTVVNGDQVVHHVAVRRGADRWLWALQRIGHELEHGLDQDFDNAGHAAHRGHGCLRSYSFWRTWDHAEHATPAMAQKLLDVGWLELVHLDGRWHLK